MVTDRSRRRARPNKGNERLTLRGIREAVGKTQAEVAAALETDRGNVSRIENREDQLISTMRKYAAALGGRYEGAIVFPTGHRIGIAEPEPER